MVLLILWFPSFFFKTYLTTQYKGPIQATVISAASIFKSLSHSRTTFSVYHLARAISCFWQVTFHAPNLTPTNIIGHSIVGYQSGRMNMTSRLDNTHGRKWPLMRWSMHGFAWQCGLLNRLNVLKRASRKLNTIQCHIISTRTLSKQSKVLYLQWLLMY